MNSVDLTLVDHFMNIEALDLLLPPTESQIRGWAVPWTEARLIWQQLRDQATQTGYWPLIVGSYDHLEALIENLTVRGKYSPAEIVLAGTQLDLLAWLIQRPAEDLDFYTAPRGYWPEIAPSKNHCCIYRDVWSGEPLNELLLALVPTVCGWQSPAFLKFGGWNDCPMPEVHVAFMARWQQLYGAEVVAIVGDMVEFAVERPPRDRDSALQLAHEQFLYCTDIVYQGSLTLEDLAATLENNHVWTFWWD
jgi:hypothetical protein